MKFKEKPHLPKVSHRKVTQSGKACVSPCVSPSGPHRDAHTADNGAAAEKGQSDGDWDEPAVSAHREYHGAAACLSGLPPREAFGTGFRNRRLQTTLTWALPAWCIVLNAVQHDSLGSEWDLELYSLPGWMTLVITDTDFLLGEDDPTGWGG